MLFQNDFTFIGFLHESKLYLLSLYGFKNLRIRPRNSTAYLYEITYHILIKWKSIALES